MSTIETTTEIVREERPRTQHFMGRLLRKPVALVAIGYLVLIIVLCLGAPIVSKYDPLVQDLYTIQSLPTGDHWLGTDALGRDVVSRLLYGGLVSLYGVGLALVVFAVVGISIGLLAGYTGGLVDRIISTTIEIVLSIPHLVIILAVLAIFGTGMTAPMITLGILACGGLARIVRANTVAAREELYVGAAKVSGLGSGRIIFRHILPNLTGPIIVQLSLFAGNALATQAGLAFLSLGVQPPDPSWGGMVGEASQVILQFPWLLVPSGGIIALTMIAFGLLGDAAREASFETHQRSAGIAVRHKIAPAGDGSAASSSGEDILSVDGLNISFQEAKEIKEIVKDISFAIRPGEIVGLVGESGSGKTVTGLALLDLLPANALVTAKASWFKNVNLQNPAEIKKIRGKGIAMIWQEPMVSLDPVFTVGSQLGEVIKLHNRQLSKAQVRQRAVELLKSVKIKEPEKVLKQFPHQLSGGMAQRVVIAQALAGDPELLIADEPTTALDVTVQADILDLLRDIRRERNMAILLITHDFGVVADLCDSVLVMRYGQIVERGEVVKLFTMPQHDYTRSLLAATPSLVKGTL
ncbi:MAG: dipeptide/oligopeptide/nickel ABC transporter permease/ATP-binding protein [Chloroflexi bacterium]|nr:dipeptide/oligopeptide/nickel ABC transporter permease/ATP-binding protein [Chloroflexota bacterium]OJW05452.1 MAG: hypothetical protein BGO39_15825 [Chloroflexi bacterium 54-19]